MDLLAGVVIEVEMVIVVMETASETIPERGRGGLSGMVWIVCEFH